MGKFETECPSCEHKQKIEVSGISELPKTVMCGECGQGYTKNKLPIK